MSLESVQLIKCLVRNSSDQTSYRLIEKDNYDLWRYLVTTKHHITIIESVLCLWVSQQSYEAKGEIYRRAGQSESANRILLMMYDDHGNFNNTCRYVMEADSAAVEKILLTHIPQEQQTNQQYTLETESGQLITKGPLHQLSLTPRDHALSGQSSK